jgi:hypothetical protein
MVNEWFDRSRPAAADLNETVPPMRQTAAAALSSPYNYGTSTETAGTTIRRRINALFNDR